MSTNRWGLFLEPLDVLFFRDGRPFGPAMHGQSGLPAPQTLAGAVITALLGARGADFARLSAAVRQGASFAEGLDTINQPTWIADVAVRGPWFAVRDGDERLQDVLVPVPAILQQCKSAPAVGPGRDDIAATSLPRLRPLDTGRLPGWQPPRPGMRPLWCQQVGGLEPVQGFLDQRGLRAFLAGEEVCIGDLWRADKLFANDRRTGIAIDAEKLVAQEGLIYAASFLTLQPHVGFYAEVVAPRDVNGDAVGDLRTMAFGGEGRHVRVHVQAAPWAWPEMEPQAADQKPLVMFTTPGLFRYRWYPQTLERHLIAAAVPGDLPISGWDLARGGPKRTRFATQPGSVYFLNEPLANWPAALSDDPFDCQQGWGCYLRGVWTDE